MSKDINKEKPLLIKSFNNSLYCVCGKIYKKDKKSKLNRCPDCLKINETFSSKIKPLPKKKANEIVETFLGVLK